MKVNNLSIYIYIERERERERERESYKYRIYEPLSCLIMVKFNKILPYVSTALILTGYTGITYTPFICPFKIIGIM